MERKIINDLLKWKKDVYKPLLLFGTKQVGKTYTAIEFGRKYFKNIAYIDSYNNKELIEILKHEKIKDRLISKLSNLVNETILKNDTLIIIDNISISNIINCFKIFSQEDNEYKILMITSRRDNYAKYKGEELYFKTMYPMDFDEFLINCEKKQLVDFIKQSYESFTTMPFHQLACELYDEYLRIGGYPEVVQAYLDKKDDLVIESIKKKIIDLNNFQILNISNIIDIVRSNDILESISYQLKKDNKKFQYGLIKLGSRQKDYLNGMNYLNTNMIINKCYRLTDIKSPLSTYKDTECFKVYYNDTGLLYTLLHLNKNNYMNDPKLKRILIENNISNTLQHIGYNLYYYLSDGKAEINFVIQNKIGDIIPLDLVNKNQTKAKALSVFMSKFPIDNAIKVTHDNFSIKRNIKYIPNYAIFCLKNM